MPKSALSRETLQILESMWAEGVQSYSSDGNKHKVQQVAEATGLVEERIKVWIYNRNRRKKVEGDQTKRKRLTASKASCTVKDSDAEPKGHQVTEEPKGQQATEEAKGQQATEEASQASQEQTELEEEEAFEEEASFEEETSRAIMDLPLDGKEQQPDAASQLIQSVEEKIQKLQASNCEVLMVVYNQRSGSLYTTGTPNGLEFLNSQNPGIHWQFAGAMSTSSCFN